MKIADKKRMVKELLKKGIKIMDKLELGELETLLLQVVQCLKLGEALEEKDLKELRELLKELEKKVRKGEEELL